MGDPMIHEQALVEEGATIGDGTQVWSGAHVRSGAVIGRDCRLGDGVFVDAGVTVGDRCKLVNGAMLFAGTVLGDGVFVGPGAIVTNDRHPRAIRPDGSVKGQGDWELSGVTVDAGASIGAGAVLVAGVRVGAWALVGAGAVVSRSVPPHTLVVGNPARAVALVCRCAVRLNPDLGCPGCGLKFVRRGETLTPAG
jgi:UDP-2-acetamido-3-amino-2,3-dideoxy-glucuronate N-acetyltransferase